MIAASPSQAVALWALRIRVWDLLMKPLSEDELGQRIGALIALTLRRTVEPSRNIRFPSQVTEPATIVNGPPKQSRTQAAITHVTRHFDREITVADVATLCRLSPSRFSHVFRQERGASFAQHVLRYRLRRACEQLSDCNAFAKEVAYAVGFNDLSYFTRAFKRQLGVCPSKYQAKARLS